MRKKPYPIVELTGGLDLGQDPILLVDKSSPNILNARFDKGVVKKDVGLQDFDTLPVVGTPMLADTFYQTNGNYYLLLATTRHLYQWDDTNNHWQCITRGTAVSSCESGWVASAGLTGASGAVAHVAGVEGTNCVQVTIPAGFTTGLAATEDFAAKDLSGDTGLHLYIKSSVATAAGDLVINIDETAACASPDEAIDVPALSADTWTRIYLPYAAAGSTRNATVSVGLTVAVDKGAQVVSIDHIRSTIPFTGDEDDRFSIAYMNDYAIFSNFVDVMVKYDGTTVALVAGTPPKARAITVFYNCLVCAGIEESGTDYPQRVRWSDLGDFEDWTIGTGHESGYVDLVDTVDWCTAVITLMGRCIVYKERSIWELIYVGGDAMFQPLMRLNGIGTLSPQTIADLGEEHLFFSADDVYAFDGLRREELAEPIYALLYETATKIVQVGYLVRACGTYLEEIGEYWIVLATGTDTTPKTLLKYNFKTKGWVRVNSFDCCAFAYHTTSPGYPAWSTQTQLWSATTGTWRSRSLPSDAPTTLIFTSTGITYMDDRTAFNSNEFVFETRDFVFGQAVRWLDVQILARYGGFTFYYSSDGGTTWSSGQTFGYVSDWTEFSIPLNLTSMRTRFRITTSESQLELLWIEPWYIERKRAKLLAIS